MKSISFNSKKLKSKKIKAILPSLYISECYNKYTNITQFNKTITNKKLLNDIAFNLNNSLNLFYNDPHITVNIIDALKARKNYQPVTPLELIEELQNSGLSLGQANYITVFGAQSGIGKSNLLHHVTSKMEFNSTTFIHRPSSLSQIIVDNDKNVQYIGGQFILFDITQQKYLENLNKDVGIENHLLHQSHDRIILYVIVYLGKLGQELTKESFNIHIDVASEGELGDQILAAFSPIKLTCENIDFRDVVSNYIEFSDKTLYRNKLKERYELIYSIIENKKTERKEGSNNICSEDMDTLLTINAINLPNKKKVELILKEGANANCFDQNHNTILHLIALECGSCEIAQVLLAHGADPNIINYDGDTPLHIADKNNYKAMIILLTNNGADINVLNRVGYTYNSPKGNISSDGELQIFNNLLLEREFCNVSLHSLSTTDLKVIEEDSIAISTASKHSSSWNLFKNIKTATKQSVIGALNKNPNKPNLSCNRGHDNIILEDILNLFEIVKKIVHYTITSDDIVQLQKIFATTSIKNTKDQFVTQLNCVLSNNQLHNLNTVIMQTMHQLLPEEDKICYLRSSEHKIFHDLLLLEAKRHEMTVPLPNDATTPLSMPTIPDAILDLYATLEEYFYNRKERQSSESLKDRIVKSIQWLFINPLIANCPIDLQLLKIPGEYTKLLIQNNIPDLITHIDSDSIQTFTNKELYPIINQIFAIYVPDLTNLMAKEILNKTTLNITQQSSEDVVTNLIVVHLQMYHNPYILLSNSELILDEISNFVKALYTPIKNQKQAALSIFLYHFISKMNLENQITTKEDYQVKQHITNTDTVLDVISHINNIIKSIDRIIHDSCTAETINLLHCNNDYINNAEDSLTSLGAQGLDLDN